MIVKKHFLLAFPKALNKKLNGEKSRMYKSFIQNYFKPFLD